MSVPPSTIIVNLAAVPWTVVQSNFTWLFANESRSACHNNVPDSLLMLIQCVLLWYLAQSDAATLSSSAMENDALLVELVATPMPW
jgi:hypothetical protein